MQNDLSYVLHLHKWFRIETGWGSGGHDVNTYICTYIHTYVHTGHGAEGTSKMGGKMRDPGPHSYKQLAADYRIQGTKYSIQACRHRKIKGCRNKSMHRIQDTGYS